MSLLVVLVWGMAGHGDVWFVPLPDQRLWLRKIHWPRQSASAGRLELRKYRYIFDKGCVAVVEL